MIFASSFLLHSRKHDSPCQLMDQKGYAKKCHNIDRWYLNYVLPVQLYVKYYSKCQRMHRCATECVCNMTGAWIYTVNRMSFVYSLPPPPYPPSLSLSTRTPSLPPAHALIYNSIVLRLRCFTLNNPAHQFPTNELCNAFWATLKSLGFLFRNEPPLNLFLRAYKCPQSFQSQQTYFTWILGLFAWFI